MTINSIEKSQQGDKDAVLNLVEKFNPLLKKYAYKLNYEDAYNDLLVNFIEILHSIRLDHILKKDEGSIVSYICTSVHSSYVKRIIGIKQLRNTILYSDLNDYELYYIEAMSSTYDTYLSCELLYIKNVLTKSERAIIKMIYYLGYTVTETANLQGISRQAVNQAKKRALEKLKLLLSDKHESEATI